MRRVGRGDEMMQMLRKDKRKHEGDGRKKVQEGNYSRRGDKS